MQRAQSPQPPQKNPDAAHLCNLLAHRLGPLQHLSRGLQHALLKGLDVTKNGGQEQVEVGVLRSSSAAGEIISRAK